MHRLMPHRPSIGAVTSAGQRSAGMAFKALNIVNNISTAGRHTVGSRALVAHDLHSPLHGVAAEQTVGRIQ